MDLLVTLDFRFVRTPDGQVWTRTAYSYAFWDRYLKVFDHVKIVARAEAKPSVDEQYKQVNGPGVTFLGVPFYLGPWQYLKAHRRVRQAVRSSVSGEEAVLCRVASQLASELLPALWAENRPYGLEVVGDPYEAGTSLHVYNHRFGFDLWQTARFAKFQPLKVLRCLEWDTLAKAMFDQVIKEGGIYHIWGHSWEIDEHDDWERLENVFRYISANPKATYVTNGELEAYS